MVELEPDTQGSHSLTDCFYQESHRGRRRVMSGQVSGGLVCCLHFILNVKVLKQGVRASNGPQTPSRLIMWLFQTILLWGFPGGATGKEPICQCRVHERHGFEPWTRKVPWRRAWQPTPVYSCLENPMDKGAWRATVHWVTKSLTQLKQLSTFRQLLGLPGPWRCLSLWTHC